MSISTSKWANYIKERENVDILETPEGFATYKINKLECYLKDLYVHPEYRQKHIATELTNQVVEIAKEKGCKYLVGSVCPSAKNSHQGLIIFFKYGMKLHSCVHDLIYLIKEIE